MVGLGKRLPKVPIGIVEILLWTAVVALGWLLGGPVGPGTLLGTFGAGLVMQLVYSILRFDPRDIKNRDVLEVTRELAGKDRYPVVTLVLNFSTKRWGKAKSLYDCLHVPEELRPYVSNYRINVFDIAFLTDEQISRFHNDFKIVADYFAHHRTDPDYRPTDPEKFRHTDEILKLFSVLMNDPRFEMTLKSEKGGKPNNMCEALDRIEAKGEKRGILIGEKKGEKRFADLLQKLLAANRTEDIAKIASDTRYRNKLYKEFQIN